MKRYTIIARHGVHVAVLASVVLFGCVSQLPPRQITICPPKHTPQCLPTKASVAALDTNSQAQHESYYSFRSVRGLNTDSQEYGVFLSDKTQGIVTSGRSERTTLHAVRFIAGDSAVVEAPLDGADSLNCGFVSANVNGEVCVTARWSEDRMQRQSELWWTSFKPGHVSWQSALRGCTDSTVWNSHPSLSGDGTLLFFASDREGGFGGSDIWYMVQGPKGEWSAPINAGAEINTACDEICPFLCPDNKTLLFSSCGHQSFGGYDIMSSTVTANKAASRELRFAPCQTLPPPINSSSDELFASTRTSALDELYFSSDRAQQGNFDIYHCKLVRNKKPKEPTIALTDNQIPKDKAPDSIDVHGRVYRSQDSVVRHAEIVVYDRQNSHVLKRTSSDDSGEFRVRVPNSNDIEIVAQSTSGFFDSYRVRSYPKEATPEVSFDFHIPDILALRINFPENVSQAPYTNVLDSNGVETSQQWTELLDLIAQNLKKTIKDVKKVVLVGHTDENGTIEYNKDLGKRRVAFVVDQLVARGIPRSIFDPQSAGEMEPLARRKDEALDSYNKRNRRVELTKIMR